MLYKDMYKDAFSKLLRANQHSQFIEYVAKLGRNWFIFIFFT